MKPRIKITLPYLETRDEAEATVGAVALVTISQQKLTAKMDAEIAEVRKKYEKPLSEMAEVLKIQTDKLCAWATANPDQFPKGRKSIQFVQGTIGFRKGTPKVALLSRAWTWKKVLAAIKEFGLGRHFIHTEETVAKDLILASHSGAKDQDLQSEKVLKPIGVKVTNEETFFIEPNLTDVETRQTQNVEAA